MTTPYAERLMDLLPPVYRERDNGDLAAFLGNPGATLDEIESNIYQLASIYDVDTCNPRFLPLLAALVGVPFDPRRDTDRQRRAIREAVEGYRRKGTVAAMVFTAERLGWNGRIDETFQHTCRLNRRARLNKQRLAGEFYGLGVYRVVSNALISGLRETLAQHHPAGTRQFFTWCDSDSFVQGGPRAAANLLFVTRWPSEVVA